MARPDPWVSVYSSGHPNVGVAAVLEVLATWFDAIEDGSVEYWLPDPAYARSKGRGTWSQHDLDCIIAAIDEEYDKEAHGWARKPSGYYNGLDCDAGPGFSRLAPAQRLALVQELDRVVALHASDLTTQRLDEYEFPHNATC